ncbi:homeobox protein HMX3-B-like [Clarias magur]|uniref:Homeobox protein HMX3-B-like n=1 Tax=Clarias magur TaxID=1594786 RepID=A0A8J4U873_CLAMG|nr:homeobox protein HMX3-B-like [Clarias magur]
MRRPAALKFTIDHILNKESDANRPNSQLSPESSFSSCHKPVRLANKERASQKVPYTGEAKTFYA